MNNFKEQLKMDAQQNQSNLFKAKIKFDGMDFLVYDCFEYEGEKYYYIIEDKSESFKSNEDLTKFYENPSEKIRIEFIFECDKNSHIYQVVTDSELLDKLNLVESKRILENNN